MNEQILESLKTFIGKEIEPAELALHLDKVLWGYALYMLRDTDLCGHPENADSLFFIKQLRDILTSKENL